MSLSDSARTASPARLSRRFMLGVALAGAAVAGGCLRPLYADSTASKFGGSVRGALRDIEIPEIKGLVGHYLRNELVFETDGGGEASGPKRFTLLATIKESLEVHSIDQVSGRADSAILIATATWSLTRAGAGEVVSSGVTTARIPYERSTQRFATVRAARDAQIQAGKELATLIRGLIAADLANG